MQKRSPRAKRRLDSRSSEAKLFFTTSPPLRARVLLATGPLLFSNRKGWWPWHHTPHREERVRDTRPQHGVWKVGSAKSIALDRPRLIAVLNLTPDSFYDGGRLPTVEAALRAAERALEEGADALDLGGESTRPGAAPVTADEQARRVIPVVEAIRSRAGPLAQVPISVDTRLASVARAALDAGADIINDVSAGRDDPAMLPLAAERRTGLVLMHRLRSPSEDSYSDRYQRPPLYDDVVAEVAAFLRDRAAAAVAAGIAPERTVLDPGLGFGKTVAQNLELVRRTPELAALGFPILSALSRKSFVARAAGMADSTPGQRLEPTLALSVAHLAAGARLFRIHDVAPHARALAAAWRALPPHPHAADPSPPAPPPFGTRAGETTA
jgi:dihydropteroate synthase